jgi:hypothetical protein
MPAKSGRIVGWGRHGSKFTEAFLEGGERVELSDEALAVVRAHDPADYLVFVERRGRIFRYVQWVGTCQEAVLALKDGTLRPGEIPAGVLVVGEYLLRHPAGAEGALPSDSPAPMSTTPDDLPTTLDEALSRFSVVPVPPGMRDPGTDANLAAYARSLTTATWRDWQVVHLRADRPKIVDLYQALIGRVGEDQAKTMCTIANRAGVAVNSLVLGYFGRQIDEAKPDPRLVVTWCDIGDAHGPHGPHYGIVVDGAWGILLRDLLAFDARDECYQPFARCVDAAVFGLAGVYQWGVEGPPHVRPGSQQ